MRVGGKEEYVMEDQEGGEWEAWVSYFEVLCLECLCQNYHTGWLSQFTHLHASKAVRNGVSAVLVWVRCGNAVERKPFQEMVIVPGRLHSGQRLKQGRE